MFVFFFIIVSLCFLTVFTYLFLHESISLQQLVGIVVIIGGLSIYFVLPERNTACG